MCNRNIESEISHKTISVPASCYHGSFDMHITHETSLSSRLLATHVFVDAL